MTRFLALGDSYTIGEGVQEPERWPDQLVAMLRVNGVSITDLQIIAQTAWTSDELSDAIDQHNPTGPFDLVTLMIGVNDQYRSRPVSSFTGEYAALLKRSKALAKNRGTRVVAISIPDWGATPFARGRDAAVIGSEIEAYNAASRSLARDAGVHWIDVTDISRAMEHDPTLVSVDGLHPTGAMYTQWAERILPVVLKALRV